MRSSGQGSRLVVTGVPQLTRALDTMANDLTDLSEVTGRTASLITAKARSLAPVDTGRLQASLRPYSGKFRAGVSSRVPYANTVHYGSKARKRPARPFATRAARITEPTWSKWYADYVNDLCAAAARSVPRVTPRG